MWPANFVASLLALTRLFLGSSLDSTFEKPCERMAMSLKS
jgi:hypothetical protein